MTPTRIYVAGGLAAVRDGLVKGLAHITGGGLVENIPRILPAGLSVTLNPQSWSLPPVMAWLASVAGMTPRQLATTFNMGLGMVAVVAPDKAGDAAASLAGSGETVMRVGTVVTADGDATVDLAGAEAVWPG